MSMEPHLASCHQPSNLVEYICTITIGGDLLSRRPLSDADDGSPPLFGYYYSHTLAEIDESCFGEAAKKPKIGNHLAPP